MKRYSVVFRPLAEDDVNGLYAFIAAASGYAAADDYVERISSFCAALEIFPNRGSLRNDLGPDVRLIGFERRVAIAFRVRHRTVEILRVLYGGRDFSRLDQIDS